MRNLTSRRTTGSAQWIALAVIASSFCAFVLACISGVTGIFRLSSDTAALRTSFMESVPGAWDTKIALRAGWLTASAIRFGSAFVDLPPEPRAALRAFKGAEVGIYSLGQSDTNPRLSQGLDETDRVMKSRGWDRIVGVVDREELVLVYWPRKTTSTAKATCCVLVFDGKQLIVSSARLNLEPLFELVSSHVNLEELKRQIRAEL